MDRFAFSFLSLFCLIPLPARGGAAATRPAASAEVTFDGLDTWVEYAGDLDGKLRIGMTLRVDNSTRTGTGCYYYAKYCKDIRISAAVEGRRITIDEFDAQGKAAGRFAGEFVPSDPRQHFAPGTGNLNHEVIVGKWSRPDGSEARPFYLIETHAGIVHKGECRYSVAGFNEERSADDFMARFRSAILDHDASQVAAMVAFPIRVRIDGKMQPITGREALLKNYDAIFTPGYVNAVRAAVPFHLFARDQGIMLGNGEVWIAPAPAGPDRAAKASNTRVIAINN